MRCCYFRVPDVSNLYSVLEGGLYVYSVLEGDSFVWVVLLFFFEVRKDFARESWSVPVGTLCVWGRYRSIVTLVQGLVPLDACLETLAKTVCTFG